jgi:hypothetical protein
MTGTSEKLSGVRLVLITGNPGGWKSVVSKLLWCGLPEEWQIVTLDSLFYISQGPALGDNWTKFEAGAAVRAQVIKYFGDRRGRVIAEGIVQTDKEVSAYSGAMGLTPESDQVRFFDLRCSREEAIRRMKRRPIMERPDVDLGAQYDWLSSKLKATGAQRIWTDGIEPDQVASEILSAMRVQRRFS